MDDSLLVEVQSTVEKAYLEGSEASRYAHTTFFCFDVQTSMSISIFFMV